MYVRIYTLFPIACFHVLYHASGMLGNIIVANLQRNTSCEDRIVNTNHLMYVLYAKMIKLTRAICEIKTSVPFQLTIQEQAVQPLVSVLCGLTHISNDIHYQQCRGGRA